MDLVIFSQAMMNSGLGMIIFIPCLMMVRFIKLITLLFCSTIIQLKILFRWKCDENWTDGLERREILRHVWQLRSVRWKGMVNTLTSPIPSNSPSLTSFLIYPQDKYRLHYGMYSGQAGDALSGGANMVEQWSASHNGMQFSTRDQDHDRYQQGNCAVENRGGWWYNRWCWGLSGLYDHSSFVH